MEATIDTLQIKVEADASNANKQLGLLTRRLSTLQNFKENTNININTGNSISALQTLYSNLMRVWGLLKKIRKNAYLKIDTEVVFKNANAPKQDTKAGKNPNDLVNVPPTTGTTKLPNLSNIDWSKLTKALQSLKNAKVFDKVKEFGNSIKRIALYRIIRSIIKMVEQALKEGIQNLYQYSKATDTTFSKSLDKITTSFEYLKNSFVTIFEPLINAITPFVEKVVDSVARIFTELSMSINQALGNDKYTEAIKNVKKFNAELKKTVLGFDEINKMNGEDDEALMKFEEKSIDPSKLKQANDTAKTVQEVIKAIGAWFAGTSLGKFFAGIAQTFSGVEMSSFAIGESIAGAALSIYGIINDVTGFIKQFGKNEGEMSTDSLIDIFKGNLGLILGGALLGTAFGNPLLGLEIGTIVAAAGDIVAALGDAISNKVTWENALLSTSSFTAIGTIIGTMISPGIGTAIGAVAGLIVGEITNLVILIVEKWDSDIAPIFDAIIKEFNAIWEYLSDLNQSILDWITDIPNKVKTTISDIKSWFGNLGENLLKLNDDILASIRNLLSTIGTEIKKYLESPIKYIGNVFISVINFCLKSVEDMINFIIKGLNKIIAFSNIIGIIKVEEIAPVHFGTIPQLASGGLVDAGQLFIANENGAEFISSYNGKTAVANNEQIVRGITEGVREAFRESDYGGNWTIQIIDEYGSVKSETIISALERKNRRDGKTIVAVGV